MRKIKITVKNLEKKFKQKIVLKNLSLDIFESESLSIIGESGSGKSILTRCIIGLISYDRGIVSLEGGINIQEMSYQKRMNYMSKFGILFQNVLNSPVWNKTFKAINYLSNQPEKLFQICIIFLFSI